MEFSTHFEPIGDQTFGGAMSVKSVESVKSVLVKKGYGYKIRARKRNGRFYTDKKIPPHEGTGFIFKV